MNVVPENLEEQPPILDLLLKGEDRMRCFFSSNLMSSEVNFLRIYSHLLLSDVLVSVDISLYEIPDDCSKMNGDLTEPEPAGDITDASTEKLDS